MLDIAVALLILQELVQKAAPAPAAPAPSSEVIGKAAAAPAVTSCVAMPDAGYQGAGSLQWYIDSETVEVGGSRFAKYGLPRVLGPGEVEYVATARGGLFYGEAGVGKREVLYLLTVPAGCEFQPYAIEG
jgi:hypothetical protein